MQNKLNKCAILARQSSTDGDTSLSIDGQLETCRALAAERGLEVLAEEKELDTSGRWYPAGFEALAASDMAYQGWVSETRKTAKARQGLGRILGMLDKIAYVVVFDATRFARPLDGSFLGPLLTQLLTAAGVKILSCKEGELDFAKFSDRLVNTLSSSINSEQIALSKEKAKKSYARLKDDGWLPNGGSRITGFSYQGKFRLAEDEFAPAVRYILARAAAGDPLNRICRAVNKTFKAPAKRWYLSTIRNILKNPVYCGLIRTSDGRLVKSRQTDGLVPYEIWRAASERLKTPRARTDRERKNPITLSGMLVDGYTGEKMIGGVSKGMPYWIARSKWTAGKRAAKAVRWDSRRPSVTWLKETLRPFVWPFFVEKYRAWLASRANPELVEKLKMEIDAVRDRENSVAALIMDGLLDKDAAAKKLKEGRDRRARLEAELAALSYGPTREEMFGHWNLIQAVLHGRAPEAVYVAVLREAVEKITCWDDRILVEGRWGSVELPRLIRKNHAAFPRPVLDAELSPEHQAGVHDPLGLKLIVKYVYGPGGEKTLFDGPNFKVVKKG